MVYKSSGKVLGGWEGITDEKIVKDIEVKQQLIGLLCYVDLNKMVTTFFTLEIWNKLGSIRGK